MWDHKVLPATRQVNTPRLNPNQAGQYSTYLPQRKAELTLVVAYIPRWFTCLQTVTHSSSNYLIATCW